MCSANADVNSTDSSQQRVAIACQGGGAHAAYVAGALETLLQQLDHDSAKAGKLRLVAISGTSGGAICALLAWWGLLTGGPRRAIERLRMFWENNSALKLGEVLWDTTTMAALEMQPCEAQWSPSAPPLREAVAMTTEWWPQAASWLGEWIRPGYFKLKESVGLALEIHPDVDFKKVVQAIGELCSLPADVQHWQAQAIQQGIGVALPGTRAARRRAAPKTFLRTVNKLERAMETLSHAAENLGGQGWLSDAVQQFPGNPGTAGSPHAVWRRQYLPTLVTRWLDPALPTCYQTGLTRILAIERELHDAIARIPRLMLGAVEIDSGRFQAFRSDREAQHGGITLDAVAASAAIPYLFEAVDVEDEYGKLHPYWDGLFSQNPPIKNFLEPTGRTPFASDSKPDEIWIIQVNPRRCHTYRDDLRLHGSNLPHQHKPRPKQKDQFDVFDRRNELSGNLSLLQEADFIDAINRRLPGGHAGHGDKRIQVFSIPLDDKAARAKAGRELGFPSKVCRDRRFKDALFDHGLEQAKKFIPVRDFVLHHFVLPPGPTISAYAYPTTLNPLLGNIGTLHATFPVDFHPFIEEIAIGEHPACGCRHHTPWDVSLHWRAWAAGPVGGVTRRVILTGKLHFALSGNPANGYGLTNGTLTDVQIEAVR